MFASNCNGILSEIVNSLSCLCVISLPNLLIWSNNLRLTKVHIACKAFELFQSFV